MLQKSRKLLAITLTLALSLYIAPLAFAQMAGHDGGGTTGAHHDGGTGTGHHLNDGHAHNPIGNGNHFTGDGHNHGGTGTGHHLNDGHTHNPVGNGTHFSGDGHNHSAGHKGHDHGGMVNGVNHFSARGTVVVEPAADPADPTAPVTMTVNLQQANSRLRDLVGTDVELTISPNAYVMIAGVGPGVLENILADDMVKVMGSIVKSKDGTTLIYEATQIVVY